MSKFMMPQIKSFSALVEWLQRFILDLNRELGRIERKVPKAPPKMEEILTAVAESPEVKDAFYRYIKDREARENA